MMDVLIPEVRSVEVFAILDRSLSIESDSSEVMQYVGSAYARLRDPGQPQGGQRDRGCILYAGAPTPLVTFNDAPLAFAARQLGTPFAAGFYASSALFRMSLRRSRGWRSIYAAGLSIRGRAVLVAGPSKIGKTTLALELLRRGARLYGDEFVCIRNRGNVIAGFPRTMMVRENTLALVDDNRLRAACTNERSRFDRGARVWNFVDAGEIFGEAVFARPAALSAAVLLDREPGSRPVLERLSSAAAATQLAIRFNADYLDFAGLANIAELFARVPCYRLSSADLGGAANALCEAL